MRGKELVSLMLLTSGSFMVVFPRPGEMPEYVYEMWYEVYTNKSGAFNQYFSKVKEADLKTNTGRQRWVDTHPWSNLRIIGFSAKTLAELDTRPSNEMVLRNAFGDEESQKYTAVYLAAQISRTSYIRRYRNDLSLNRENHTRAGMRATAYLFVTVKPMKGLQFEQGWLKALSAYKKISPKIIITAAQTITGPGPEYVFARPLKNYSEFETDLTPEQAIEKAFGKPEADAFNRILSESVHKWETLIFDKGNLDTNLE